MAAETESEPIPPVKDLASSETSLRRKNLQQIQAHLESRSAKNHLTHTQALQLWRGFHVALYMHDSKNQLSVQTLIATLASTFGIIRSKDLEIEVSKTDSKQTSVNSQTKSSSDAEGKDGAEDEFNGFDDDDDDAHNGVDSTKDDSSISVSDITSSWLYNYSTAFWETIEREWSGIDQWRMDKYLLLIRFVLREMYTISLSAYLGIEDSDGEETELKDNKDNDTATTSTKRNTGNENQTSKSSSSPSTKKRKTPSDQNGDEKTSTSNTSSKPLQTSKKPKLSSSSTRSPASAPTPSHTTTTPTKTLLQTLTLHPLSPKSRKTPDGLRIHVLDIYTAELTRVLSTLSHSPSQRESTKSWTIETFSAPIRTLAREALNRHIRLKASEVLDSFEADVREV